MQCIHESVNNVYVCVCVRLWVWWVVIDEIPMREGLIDRLEHSFNHVSMLVDVHGSDENRKTQKIPSSILFPASVALIIISLMNSMCFQQLESRIHIYRAVHMYDGFGFGFGIWLYMQHNYLNWIYDQARKSQNRIEHRHSIYMCIDEHLEFSKFGWTQKDISVTHNLYD